METREHVIPGMPIESADGTTIGTVKEVAGGVFKVDAPLRPDYWLPCNLVGSHTAAALQLRIDRVAVMEHRLKEAGDRRRPAGRETAGHERDMAEAADRAMSRYRTALRDECDRRERRERALRVAAMTAGAIVAAGGAIAGYKRAASR